MGKRRRRRLLMGANNLVCLDADVPEAVRALPYALRAAGVDPRTLIGGRDQNRRTHYFYHPSGDVYNWETPSEDFEPNLIKEANAEKLEQAVRLAALAALIARHMPEGGRNQYALALSGFLRRNDRVPREAVATAFKIAWWYIAQAGEGAGNEAVRVMEATEAKLAAGEPVKGGPTVDTFAEGLAKSLLKAWGISADYRGDEITGDDKRTQADVLLEIASDAELWHSPEDVPYATVAVGDHAETVRIDEGGTFTRWIVGEFYRRVGKAPGTNALTDVRRTVAAMAMHEGTAHPVWLRTARGPDGTIYVDLGTSDWSAVKITGEGWAVVGSRDVPVKFLRGSATGALPVPTPGWGDVRELRRFVNVEGEAGFKLVLAWLIQSLKPEGPYPLLNIEGEQGSAKSSTAKVLYSLVSPSAIPEPLRTLPKDERDLLVAARNNWCLAYDNLFWMPEWLSDALCRLATGGAFGTRTLHTNSEETLLSAKRPVIINSIGGVINRPDLQERALIVEAPFIPESGRRTEAGLKADFEEAAPVIFSGLLDGISAAMRVPLSEDTGGPRLIDFMRWVGPALEYYGYTGMEADYAAMRDEADILALENDPVAIALVANIDYEEVKGG